MENSKENFHGLSRTRAKDAHTARAYPGFRSMKQLRVLLLPPGRDASQSQGYSQQYVVGTYLYTWVERDNVGQSILSKETTQWQGLGVETPTLSSEVQRANHYTTALPHRIFISGVKGLDLPLVKAKFHPHVYDINFFILDFASIQAIFCDTCPMSE